MGSGEIPKGAAQVWLFARYIKSDGSEGKYVVGQVRGENLLDPMGIYTDRMNAFSYMNKMINDETANELFELQFLDMDLSAEAKEKIKKQIAMKSELIRIYRYIFDVIQIYIVNHISTKTTRDIVESLLRFTEELKNEMISEVRAH